MPSQEDQHGRQCSTGPQRDVDQSSRVVTVAAHALSSFLDHYAQLVAIRTIVTAFTIQDHIQDQLTPGWEDPPARPWSLTWPNSQFRALRVVRLGERHRRWSGAVR
jgi:hypothetical protein